MKKIIAGFVAVFLIINGIGAIAVESSNEEKQFVKNETIHFSNIELISQDHKIKIEMDNTNSYLSIPGYPILPTYLKTFTFPLGTRINTVEVAFSEPIQHTLQNEIITMQAPITIQNGKILSAQQKKIAQNSDPFPKTLYNSNIGVGISEGEHVIFLTIQSYPVQYNPTNNQLTSYEKAEMKISYTLPEKQITFPDEYDMIVISPPEFLEKLRPLIEHKNNLGIKTKLIDVENDINSETYFPNQGSDSAEQMKYFIKNALEQWGIQYVLLVGGRYGGVLEEKWWMPVRYSHLDDGGEASFPADLYFSDIYKYDDGEILFEDWDSNGNGIHAEWKGFKKDIIDCYPDLHLGRLPCILPFEVDIMVDKIITYETETYGKEWFNKMIVVGGDSAPGDAYYEGEEENAQALLYMDGFTGIKLWTSTGTFTGQEDVIQAITEGSGFLFFDGHGNPQTWGTHPPDDEHTWVTGLNTNDMPKLNNGYKLPVAVIGGCHNGQFNVSIANILHGIIQYGLKGYFFEPPYQFFKMEWLPECWAWKLTSKKDGGSIATMAYAGLDWFAIGDYNDDGIPDCTQFFSGFFNVNFFKNYGVNDITILGEAYTQTQIDYVIQHPPMEYYLDCKTVEELTLMGDPSMKIGGYQ